MTDTETAKLLAVMSVYWENLTRGTDPKTFCRAWAVALADIDYDAASRAVVDLAKTQKWPPKVCEVRKAAKRYQEIPLLDRLFAVDCKKNFGYEIPLYKRMKKAGMIKLEGGKS